MNKLTERIIAYLKNNHDNPISEYRLQSLAKGAGFKDEFILRSLNELRDELQIAVTRREGHVFYKWCDVSPEYLRGAAMMRKMFDTLP